MSIVNTFSRRVTPQPLHVAGKRFPLWAGMRLTALWLCLWAGLALPMHGQVAGDAIQFRNVNVSHGLPNNLSWRVQALDDRSLLVVCDYAFAIYDGDHFRPCPYDFRRRYPVNTFSNSASYVDREGRVWIKNYVNLFLFDQRRGRFDYAIDSLFRAWGVESHVADFFLDGDGDAWLLTRDGRLFLHEETGVRLVWKRSAAERARGLRIVNVAQAGAECLLLGSDGSVRYYDKRRGRISRTEQLFGGTDPYVEYCWTTWGDHALVLGTSRQPAGLWRYDSGTQTWDCFCDRPHGYNRLLRLTHGGLAAVDPWGLTLFDNRLRITHDLRTFHTESRSYQNRDLLDATLDWQGGLWLSSYRYGLFYTHPSLPHFSTLPVSAEGFDKVFMASDGAGHVFATQGDTIWRLRGHATEAVHHEPRAAFSLLCADARGGRLYVRTGKSLFYLDSAGSHEVRVADVADLPALPHVLHVLPDGRLFACLGREQAGELDLQRRTFTPRPVPATCVSRYRDVRFLRYDDRRQRVVMGGKFGVFFYDVRTHRYTDLFPARDDFGGHALCCNDYLRDSRGRQWFATNAGLFLLQDEEGHTASDMRRLTKDDGLLDDCVHAVSEDSQGRVWVMTSTGLSALSGQSEESLSVCLQYDLGRLVGGGEFVDRCLAFAQGSLWCGSTNGIVRITLPDTPVGRQAQLQVRLTDFQPIGGKQAEARGELRLDTAARRLTVPNHLKAFGLRFSACDYVGGGETTYRYWLGEEETPRQVTEASLRLEYTQLAAGRYPLHVQVRQADGSWSEPQTWELRVLPPWWRTWWACLIYIAALAGLCGLGRWTWRRWAWLHAQLADRRNKLLVQATAVKPSDIHITPRDQHFLQQARDAVEAHIDDADYGVEQLSADMALTRTALYRRLQAICGQAPLEFLRTIRLRRAEQLVRESGLNVEEIARKVGFRSGTTFSSCFKQAYGLSPSAYRKQKARGTEDGEA